MENKPESYMLKIKYEENNKEKVLRLLADSKIEYKELKSKYAANWLVVDYPLAEKEISKLEKKLLEIGNEIIVEKVKEYKIWLK